MKPFSLTLAIVSLTILTGCTVQIPTDNVALQQRLENPLFAERYSEDLNDRLVYIQINDEAINTNDDLMKTIDATKDKWQKVSDDASQKRFEGKYAPFNFLSNTDFVQGSALYYNGVLYLSSDLDIRATEDVSLYVSSKPDPRIGEFPSAEDTFVTVLESPFGAQRYETPIDPDAIKSFVLYDPMLKRIMSFGQVR